MDFRSSLRSRAPEAVAAAQTVGIYADIRQVVRGARLDVRPHAAWLSGVLREARSFLARVGQLDEERTRLLLHAEAGAPFVRLSHQPNLYAGLNIAGLGPHAADVAKRIGGVPIVVTIDYDDAGEQRFRSPMLPPMSGSEPIYLAGAVARRDRDRIAFSITKPTVTQVEGWEATRRQVVRHWQRAMRLGRNSPSPEFEDTDILDGVQFLTEFSLGVLVRHLAESYDAPVLAVPASRLLPHIAAPLSELAIQLLQNNAANADLFVWRVCDGCMRRRPVRLSTSEDGLVASWECCSSGGVATEVVDWTVADGHAQPRFIPRVLLCDAVDLCLARSSASVSYAGGIAHAMQTRQTLDVDDVALTPELSWDPTGLPFGDSSQPCLSDWERGRFASQVYCETYGQDLVRDAVRASVD